MQKNQPEISKFEQDFRISKFCNIDISHHLDKQTRPSSDSEAATMYKLKG